MPAGHCFFVGAEPFGCPPVIPFLWESGVYADFGKLVNVSIKLAVTGTDSSPTFTISGAVPYTGSFHYSQLPCPPVDIGKIVGPLNEITISAYTTADYGFPFCTGSGYWQPGDCQVQIIAGGSLFETNVYEVQADGSKAYVGGVFNGG